MNAFGSGKGGRRKVGQERLAVYTVPTEIGSASRLCFSAKYAIKQRHSGLTPSKELEARRHKFARYADDFIVLVKTTKAATRVMASLVRCREGRLKLVVNRAKIRCTRRVAPRGVSRANQITRRNRGHRVQDIIDELRKYVLGWLNYYKLSCTYTVIERLAEWVRRRVRLYYWKQWNAMSEGQIRKAAWRVQTVWPMVGKQPRTRRRRGYGAEGLAHEPDVTGATRTEQPLA